MQKIQAVHLTVSEDPDFRPSLEKAAADYICALGWARSDSSQVEDSVGDWFERDLPRGGLPFSQVEIRKQGEEVVLSAWDAEGNRIAGKEL